MEALFIPMLLQAAAPSEPSLIVQFIPLTIIILVTVLIVNHKKKQKENLGKPYAAENASGGNKKPATKKLIIAGVIIGVIVFIQVITNLTQRSSEKKDWASVQETNTITGYSAFAARNPRSEFAAQANERRNELINAAWEKAKEADTTEAYNEFLNAIPGNDFAQEARDRIEELDKQIWEKAQGTNNIAALKEFIGANPSSRYLSAAEKLIEELQFDAAWKKAEKENTVAAWEEIISSFPHRTAWMEEAKSNRFWLLPDDQREWETAREKNTLAAYSSFIGNYPDSRFVQTVRAELKGREQEFWEMAKREDKKSTYDDFLSVYHESRYKGEIDARFKYMKANPAKIELGFPVTVYAAQDPDGGSLPFYKMDIVFRETGGKCGFRVVEGRRYIQDAKGNYWVSSNNRYTRYDTYTPSVQVSANGSGSWDYWLRGDEWAGGTVEFHWTFEDDYGNKTEQSHSMKLRLTQG
jgi:outer membrane protein assembly factor BamD (BamD/ComL family)